ncbi:MAG: hypothetical protein LC121_25290 [Anaerolineae bacterium]|jgi:uncharacterized damage-inducible protein DinB|nr:hypothetical protein [Anaerolineae bacterium]
MSDRARFRRTRADDGVLYASDLDNFLYCERAWWYRLQGEESSRAAELEQGAEQHETLAAEVRAADRAAARARRLIWASLALLAAVLAIRLLLGG